MLVEIVSAGIRNQVVTISAIDVSEENLQRMERLRDDGFARELDFIFDSREKSQIEYLYRWLKEQKITREAATWGEALQAVVGTITDLAPKYLSRQ